VISSCADNEVCDEATDTCTLSTSFTVQSVDTVALSPESMKELIDEQEHSVAEYQEPTWWEVLVERMANWLRSVLASIGILPQLGHQAALDRDPGKYEVVQRSLFETAQVGPELGDGTCWDPSLTADC
jgi:hypothetical protein